MIPLSLVEQESASEIRNASRREDLDVSYHARRRMLIVMFVLIGLLQTGLWLYLSRPFEPLVRIDDVRVLSGSTLCPGQSILTQYTITVRAAGVVEIDQTVQRLNGVTVLTRPTKRVVFSKPMTMTVETSWRLPATYDGANGDLRRWQAGEYVRLIAISTPLRGGTPIITTTPFRVGVCGPGVP